MARSYWAAHGIATAADVDRCLRESDGVHFSFYGYDTVAHSTILGAVPQAFQRERHGRDLASFSLSLEDLQMGRELMSGGAEMPLDDDIPLNESEALNTCDTAEASAAREARRAQRQVTREQQMADGGQRAEAQKKGKARVVP